MSHQDMVTALLQYISTDANLILVMRMQATRSITTVLSDDQLTIITQTLGLYVAPPAQ